MALPDQLSLRRVARAALAHHEGQREAGDEQAADEDDRLEVLERLRETHEPDASEEEDHEEDEAEDHGISCRSGRLLAIPSSD